MKNMMTAKDFIQAKKAQRKIVMTTCYDYPTACIIDQSDVDAVLVGDSLAMVMHGHPSTTFATMEMMVLHTQAVVRGMKHKLVVADMPFMSYRKDLNTTMGHVEQLMMTGAHAIKLEGVEGNLSTIQHIVDSGVPVMGHLGWTPQLTHALGGFKVTGNTDESKQQLIEDALRLQDAGCFSIVLYGIPHAVAGEITQMLDIATIGIGSGNLTDGQIIVMHDILGYYEHNAKFVKQYAKSRETLLDAFNQYANEVQHKDYPDNDKQSY
jgi:3-methyl-2-oxobutanoate hydroxymethyltransferase